MDAERSFRRGCLAAESALLAAHPLAAEGREGSTLLERIRSMRHNALNPPSSCLTFSEEAVDKTTATLLARVMSGRRTDISQAVKAELVTMLLSSDSLEDRAAALARQGYSYAPLHVETLNRFEAATRKMMQPLLMENDRSAAARAVRDAYRSSTTLRDALATADPADAPTLRWWSAYMHIEAGEWSTAREILEVVLEDYTSDTWPPHYLPETQYLAAMAHGRVRAGEPDHLRANPARGAFGGQGLPAQLELFSWDEVEQIVYCEIPRLRTVLANAWEESAFAAHTWVSIQVGKTLRVDDGVSPYVHIVQAVEQSWNRTVELAAPRGLAAAEDTATRQRPPAAQPGALPIPDDELHVLHDVACLGLSIAFLPANRATRRATRVLASPLSPQTLFARNGPASSLSWASAESRSRGDKTASARYAEASKLGAADDASRDILNSPRFRAA
ncbi:hypothetical protein T492DRAFT_833529 [Pavlovales sp. CCMP2436]|nr:hypothetical protein T492DRAFT_833529 [Pavlovales sp. CCMP2436]